MEINTLPDAMASESGLNRLHAQLGSFGARTMVVDHAEGVHVYDVSGRRYLDVMGGYWLACLGYGDHELVETLADASRRLSFWHLFGTAHPAAAKYAETLFRYLPESLRGKLLFANTGSGAMEIALRLACMKLKHDDKPAVFAHLDRSYHGSTFLSQHLTPFNDWPESLRMPGWQIVSLPSPLSMPNAEFCLESFRRTLKSRQPPTVLITEPIQGVGGMVVPPDGFFNRLASLCREHQVIWISDEISTSFGSTGNLFAFERDGVLPDMVVIGKRMAAGYFPMAGVIVGKPLALELLSRSFHHGYSTSGHPVGCEIARVVLQRIANPDFLATIRQRGTELESGLKRLAQRHRKAGCVRGRGLMWSLELENSQVACAVAVELAKLGIYELPEGKYLTFCPPFIITSRDIDHLLGALDEALARVVGGR